MPKEQGNGPAAVQRDEAEDPNHYQEEQIVNNSSGDHDVRLSGGELVESFATDDGRVSVRVDGGAWHRLQPADVGPLSVALLASAVDAGATEAELQQGDADEPVPVTVEVDEGVRTLWGPEHGLTRLRQSTFAEDGSTERLAWLSRWGDGLPAAEVSQLIDDLRVVLGELGRPLVEGDGEVQA